MTALAGDHPDFFPLSLTIGASHTRHLDHYKYRDPKVQAYHRCSAGDRRTLLTAGLVHAVTHCEEVIVLEGFRTGRNMNRVLGAPTIAHRSGLDSSRSGDQAKT
jgi:hypothetical protein